MDTRDVLLVDAFAAEPMAGNPTGVVTDAEGLSDDQLRAVASELAASATAFAVDSDRADRRLRYFDAEGERDRVEHATVAAHAALYERGAVEEGEYTVETGGPTIDVEVKPGGTVWLDQGSADSREVSIDHADAADALGVDVASLRDVGADLPLAVADTGEPWLVVPVNYFQHLSGLDPDITAIGALCDRVDAVGVYPFTFDTVSGEATLHGRAFKPGRGEQRITAGPAGACAAYVRKQGALDTTIDQIVVEGGHFLDRPGLVRVDTDGLEAWVGGWAVTTMQGSMTVPADTDDEILEV
jgi:PhzF family phenazine biosynthesis protein